MTRDEDHLTSDITDCLVMLLQQRDAMGRAKYGKTLDRDDLTPEQWAQHMAEELLDGAGYALAYAREVSKMRTELDALLTVRETLKREVTALRAEIAARDADLSYTTACATIRKLKTENERLRVDASRYRWIRDNGYDLIGEDRGIGPEWPDAEAVDALVDAALNATTGEGHE